MSDGRLRTFANFRIRDILDVDLVSTTYRATTLDGDESRRLRVFTGDVADDDADRLQQAVVAEARKACSVRHPHILAIHHADRVDDRAFVVSDDIHGGVLRDFIAHHHPLRSSTALAMAWQLAEALDAVHASGVVHGSINPHTIWIADSPGRAVPMTYLTGFGASPAFARHLSGDNGAPTSDDLLYVEPGQAQHGRATPEADRYALACAVYHLMTGVPPFRRGTINAQLGAHRFSSVEPPSSVRRDLPPALDSVFARALAKESSVRHPSASALMIAVERGLRGQEETRPAARERRGGAVAVDTGIADRTTPTGGAPTTAGPVTDRPPPTPDVVTRPAVQPDRETEHGPHATADRSPVAGEASPVAGEASPVAGEASPVAGEASPVAGEASPVVEEAKSRPEDDLATPEGSPVAEPPAPAQEPPPGDDVRTPHDRMVPGTGTGTGDAGARADGDTSTNGGRPQVAGPSADGGRVSVEDDTAAGGHTTGNGDAGPVEPAGPLERRRAAALEARRASRQLLSGAGAAPRSPEQGATVSGPRTMPDATVPEPQVPPRRSPEATSRPQAPAPATPAEAAGPATPAEVAGPATPAEVAGPATPAEATTARRVARAVEGMRFGVLALVAGVLVVAVAGIAGLVALRSRATDERPAPAPEPERDRREQPVTVRPLWTTPVAEGRVRAIAVTQEAVVVAAGTTVGGLDPTSGAPLWTRRAPARVADVVVAHGVVGVRTADGISGYDIDAGTPRWTLSAAELGASDGPVAVVAGGRSLYTAARDDTGIVLSAVDPAGGEVTPVTTIAGAEPGGRRAGLALAFSGASDRAGPTLYALTPEALYAVDVDEGAVRWQAPVRDGGPGGSRVLAVRPWVDSLGVAAGAAFVVDRDGRICRYAAASGERVWSTCPTFPAELEAAPTVLVGGGRVVVASDDAIATYDFTAGLPQWHETTRSPAQSAVAGGDELLYMARPDAVVALEHGSGRERWRAPAVEAITALAADADGVFAGLADGSVVRLVQRTVAQANVQ